MFPDSQIAQTFQCGPSKCSYLIKFRLAPYFEEDLITKLKKSGNVFVLSFDESFNKIVQKEQMDIRLRFWDGDKNQIVDRYFTSQFLGHTRANDLLKNVLDAVSALPQGKMIQNIDGWAEH